MLSWYSLLLSIQLITVDQICQLASWQSYWGIFWKSLPTGVSQTLNLRVRKLVVYHFVKRRK